MKNRTIATVVTILGLGLLGYFLVYPMAMKKVNDGVVKVVGAELNKPNGVNASLQVMKKDLKEANDLLTTQGMAIKNANDLLTTHSQAMVELHDRIKGLVDQSNAAFAKHWEAITTATLKADKAQVGAENAWDHADEAKVSAKNAWDHADTVQNNLSVVQDSVSKIKAEQGRIDEETHKTAVIVDYVAENHRKVRKEVKEAKAVFDENLTKEKENANGKAISLDDISSKSLQSLKARREEAKKNHSLCGWFSSE